MGGSLVLLAVRRCWLCFAKSTGVAQPAQWRRWRGDRIGAYGIDIGAASASVGLFRQHCRRRRRACAATMAGHATMAGGRSVAPGRMWGEKCSEPAGPAPRRRAGCASEAKAEVLAWRLRVVDEKAYCIGIIRWPQAAADENLRATLRADLQFRCVTVHPAWDANQIGSGQALVPRSNSSARGGVY